MEHVLKKYYCNKGALLNILTHLETILYKPHNLYIHNIVIDKENTEYSGATFMLKEKNIIFRTAKKTPTKKGLFVTVWKRPYPNNPIQPYDHNDSFDFFIIHVIEKEKQGQFIFPKSVLLKKNIISKNNRGGKRGFRVYPTWEAPDNDQARKTQLWQSAYFFEIEKENEKLYNLICLSHTQ